MTETTDIATIVTNNPVAVLVDPKTYDDFLAHIRAETDAFVPDLSTVTSRKKITSLAFKITRTKTAIDDAGKELNSAARAQIGKVDEQRRKVKADLEALAAKVRQPLTDWEQAEEARVNACKSLISRLEEIGNLKLNGESKPFPELFAALVTIDAEDLPLGEFTDQILRLKGTTLDKLTAAQEAHIKAEADKAELETLRKAEAARKALEADAYAEAMRIAAVEKEKAAQAERDHLAEQATKRAAEDAAERARDEERRIAADAIAQVEREKQALIDAAARAEAERAAIAAKDAAEQAARDADKTHRASVMKAAKEAMIKLGADEATAKKIVLAIVAGEIANTKMVF